MLSMDTSALAAEGYNVMKKENRVGAKRNFVYFVMERKLNSFGHICSMRNNPVVIGHSVWEDEWEIGKRVAE